MAKRYRITLSDHQRTYLRSLTKTGNTSAREVYRARALLYADEGRKVSEIAQLLDISEVTVCAIKRHFVTEGINRALKDNPRSGKPSKVSHQAEAHLLALACSDAPEGRQRWTLQLLADKLVELKLVESISYEAVRTILKKARLNLG